MMRAVTLRLSILRHIVLVSSASLPLLPAPQPLRADESGMSRFQRALSGDAVPHMKFGLPPRKNMEAARAESIYLKMVEGMLIAKARALGRKRYSGKFVVCFHIGPDGTITNRDFCRKSGDAAVDRFALAVVAAVAPLPPPPPTVNRGVVWAYSFDEETKSDAR